MKAVTFYYLKETFPFCCVDMSQRETRDKQSPVAVNRDEDRL